LKGFVHSQGGGGRHGETVWEELLYLSDVVRTKARNAARAEPLGAIAAHNNVGLGKREPGGRGARKTSEGEKDMRSVDGYFAAQEIGSIRFRRKQAKSTASGWTDQRGQKSPHKMIDAEKTWLPQRSKRKNDAHRVH